MPTRTVTICGVNQMHYPNGTRFRIYARTPSETMWHIDLFTWNALLASLCSQAKKIGTPVTLGYRETKWGDEIITAELAEAVTP